MTVDRTRLPGDPDFDALARLEPALAEMEVEARGIQDDGSGSFFCSNFLWLPMYTRLKTLVGVHRAPDAAGLREGVLYASDAFERAYLHLSRLLPACRDCGCRLFDPVREAQLAALRPSART